MSPHPFRDAPRPPSRRFSFSFLRAPLRVLHYLFVFLPLWGYYSFRQWPLWQRITAVVLFVSVLTAAGVLAVRYRAERRGQAHLQQAWADYEKAVKQLDTDQMKQKLNRIEELKPSDPLLAKRRRSLETGEAAADDPLMITYWLNRYVVEQKMAEATREAKKRIVSTPDDWQARCVLARDALSRGERDEARAHLEEIPSPMSGRHPVGPGELNHGLWIFRQVGVDDSSLRKYRALKIAPVLRFPDVVKFDPREQIQLLECYVGSFEDIDTYIELPQYWVGSARLAQSLADEADADLGAQVHLGRLQVAQYEILRALVARGILSSEQAKPLEDDLVNRMDIIWSRVVKMDPGEADAYLGLARVAALRDRSADVFRHFDEGMEKARDRRRVAQAQFAILRPVMAPLALYKRTRDLADRNPQFPELLQLAAESAMAAGRLDYALDICHEAQKSNRDQLWPDFLEARVYLDQERNVDKALTLIQKHQALLAVDPVAAEIYVRALVHNKKRDEVAKFLTKLAQEAARPQVALPAFRAALNLGFSVETAAASAKLLDRLVGTTVDRGVKELLYFIGESHLAAAEPVEPGQAWHVPRARIGVRALERLLTEDPNDLNAANVLTLLHLNGFNSTEAAERAAILLRAAQRKGSLPEGMYLTLGTLSLAQSRYDEARGLLERALERNPTAEEYVQLGLAQYYLKNPSEARALLSRAASLPRSARVAWELEQALSLIDGKKP
jgi:tetratricopeptide (TPR) repeat protein